MRKEKTNEYLTKEIYNKLFEKKELNEKFSNKEIATFIAFGITSIASFAALSVSVPACVSLAAIATTIAAYEYKNAKKHDSIERRLEQENKHMNKLLNDEIEINDRLIEKRKKKILSLADLREEKTQDLDFCNTLSNVIYGVTIVTSIAVARFGGTSYELILPILGVAASAVASREEIKKHKEVELIENRINNLEHDLDVNVLENNEKSIDSVENKNNNNYHNEKFLVKDYNDESVNEKESVRVYKKVK